MAQRDVTRAAEQHYTEPENAALPVIHITKTIATLTLGDGDMHPVEAAYLAIARADEDGRFEFTIPHEDGGSGRFVLTVEREYTDPKRAEY